MHKESLLELTKEQRHFLFDVLYLSFIAMRYYIRWITVGGFYSENKRIVSIMTHNKRIDTYLRWSILKALGPGISLLGHGTCNE